MKDWFVQRAKEALVTGKLAIIINFEGCSKHSPYYETEAILRVDFPDELIKTIKDVLDNRDDVLAKLKQAREDFVKYNTYLPDGKSSERVKDIIVEMIRNEM